MSDNSDKIYKQESNWNIILALLSTMSQVFILDFHFVMLFYSKLRKISLRMNKLKQNGK